MHSSDWDRLAAPFQRQQMTWRIQELAPDQSSARLRPQLLLEAITNRLDEVAGRPGWSFRFRAFGDGVGCELVVDGVARSAIVVPGREEEGPEECSRAALARAAELFGLLPPVDVEGSYWVDYDPDEGMALTPDDVDAGDAPSYPQPSSTAARRPESAGPEPVKPEGQQAIDRLVERLKLEGHALDAARLLVEYGGYGSDPQAARELYGRLRELLAKRAETPT
ncbi:MAG: hypothetical protein WD273_07670 [Trueperaceae bacterium]